MTRVSSALRLQRRPVQAELRSRHRQKIGIITTTIRSKAGRLFVVAFEIDTALPVRGLAGLRNLVQAVSTATDSDENESVEWKSNLELDKKHGSFHVARAILGMANRNPGRAARWFGGYGYVVVGAEAGSIAGTAVVDSVEYGKLIDSYVGGELGPSWTPISVNVDGVHVMVFVVEPPNPGDPIWPLRREYGRDPAGRIFVRKSGATQPALAADIDMLSNRASESKQDAELPDISVCLLADTTVGWYEEASLDAEVSSWIDGLQSTMIDRAERVQREREGATEPDEVQISSFEATKLGIDYAARRNIEALQRSIQRQQEVISKVLSSTASAIGDSLSTPDERSLDEYRMSVEDWAARSQQAATDSFTGYFADYSDLEVQVTVENRSDRFLTDVQVRIRFPWQHAHATHDEPPAPPLPSPPRPFGRPKPNIVLPTVGFSRLGDLNFSVDESIGRRTWIENGSINLTFDVGTLRPRGTDTSDVFWLLLPARPDNGTLTGTWEVTAEGIHAVVTGDLELTVADAAVSVVDVLDSQLNGPDSEQGL